MAVGVSYLKQKFSKIGQVRSKEGIFVVPQIIKLMRGSASDETVSEVERAAWRSFRAVTRNFLGNFRRKIINRLLKDFSMHTNSFDEKYH
jgi:hypothetical protein